MQGGWFGAMERIHNLESCAKEPNEQNEGDPSYFAAFFDIRHMLFFRGQLSNLDKLDKIAKLNTREFLQCFKKQLFFFPLPRFRPLFCLVNPLPKVFCDGNSETQRLHQGYQGQGCVMVFDCTAFHWANTNSTHLLHKALVLLLKQHFSSMFCKDSNIYFHNAVSFNKWIFL